MFVSLGSGSPSKTVTSPSCSAAKNYKTLGKPLPTSAVLFIEPQTEDKVDDEFTPTGSIHPGIRRSPRKLTTKKTKTGRKPRESVSDQISIVAVAFHLDSPGVARNDYVLLNACSHLRVCLGAKTPRAAASASLAAASPDRFSAPSLSGGSLPAWRRRPLPTGLSQHCSDIPCRRRPPPPTISLTESSEDDSVEFEMLLQVVDRACAGHYGTAQRNWLQEAV
jgi:hypothetical protein